MSGDTSAPVPLARAPVEAAVGASELLLDTWRTLDLDRVFADFSHHGYARLGHVLSPSGIALLAQRSDDLMMGRKRYADLFFQHDSPSGRYADLSYGKGWVGPSRHYRKLERLELDPLFRAWIENPLFERLARSHLGDAVSLYRAVLWNKAASAGTELPWHQDDGNFWGIDRRPSLQIWTAVDDAPLAAGCLRVLPGSHLAGLASPEGGTVQAHTLAQHEAQLKAEAIPVAAGESILIHNHLWHCSGRNATQAPRRALGISYLHAATRCLRRRRAPREFLRLFE